MENIPIVIGIRKEAITSRKQAATSGECVLTTNRLDSLVGNTLTAMTNNQNLYYASATTMNKRNSSLLGTFFADMNAAGFAGYKIFYYTLTFRWTTTYKSNFGASYLNPNPTLAAETALNAGTEISLFGSTYWLLSPTLDTQQNPFYAFDTTNLYFTSSAIPGGKVLINLHVKMYFGSLPADGYFIYRISDGTNNFLTTRVYNTGSSVDVAKTNNFSVIATNTLGIFKFTVQYVGSPLTRYPFAMGSTSGTRICIRDIC